MNKRQRLCSKASTFRVDLSHLLTDGLWLTKSILCSGHYLVGLYIAVQAVLALAASWSSNKVTDRTLTGTVIDSGDGVTHVIPVVCTSTQCYPLLQWYSFWCCPSLSWSYHIGRRLRDWLLHQTYPHSWPWYHILCSTAATRPKWIASYTCWWVSENRWEDQRGLWVCLWRHGKRVQEVRCRSRQVYHSTRGLGFENKQGTKFSPDLVK